MCRFWGLQWGAGLPGELPGRRGPGTEHRGVHRLSWPEGGGQVRSRGPHLSLHLQKSLPSPVTPPSSLPLPAAPRGQQYCSTRLRSTDGPLHFRKATSSSPLLPLLSPFTALASRGWGPQSWTHPTVAPQLSQPDRLTVGSRTPEPRGGQCARVPCSFFKVSTSWVCSSSGALEACGSYPRALLLDREPQRGLCCRCT